MAEPVLVLNAGSSSVKFSLYADALGEARPQLRGQIEGLQGLPRFVARDADDQVVHEQQWSDAITMSHGDATTHLLEFLNSALGATRLGAVGHRVVHGGRDFTMPVKVDSRVLTALERLIPLAPLHQPHNIAPMRVIAAHAPSLPQVACFDTAFHRTQPPVAQAFALPRAISERGVQRYGFHGLSYEYIALALADFDPVAARGRVVAAHLGNGASMCAMKGGVSVASSMGLTALDGLMMGTRCGSLDPGVILYLIDELGMDARALETLLYKESGLLGVSGISSDMRILLASDLPHARAAIDLFVYRFRRELGSMVAALDGLDALVFTGGIGEHAVSIRERVCRDAAWVGVELDSGANAAGGPRINVEKARVSAWVIPADEERMIARHTRELLGLR
ncbi:MAG TPA: acetate/propionate family kinase [Casimicrobiaceae bacterium]|jgi:acetate kinase|nr:acetate/propionate family kinase [Casimicrobiaceae bacterium]